MKNTIKLKKYLDVVNEFEAGGNITPGHLLQLGSNKKVTVHSTANGIVSHLFALEDELQGKGIDDAYASGDKVQVWSAVRGEEVYALANGAITVGEFLIAANDGTLKPSESSSIGLDEFPHCIVGIALSATTSANDRVKVLIV